MEQPNSGYIHRNRILTRRRFLAITGASAAGLLLAGVYGCGDDGGDDEVARPSGDDLRFLSLEDAAKLIAAKEVSPVDLTEAALARIERLQPQLVAFITITAEQALAQARAAEKEIAAGNYRGTLHGIPIAHKDQFDTKGVRTTSGSKVFADRVPDEDAAVVARLADAGTVSVGKLNMWEFAAAIAGVNEHWGTVRNPWDVDRLPGGTSAGSGAATAAGLVYAATGEDTGGSIRHPASFCGVVGLMPTYGRVSLHGMFPPSPGTLDHAGPLARTVRDTAVVLQVMAGRDPRDTRTADVPVPNYLDGIEQGPKGLRIGVPRDYFWNGMAPEVESVARKAIADMERAGAEVREVPFVQAQAYYDAYRVVFAIETAITHADIYPSHKADYGADLASLLELVPGTEAQLRDQLREPLDVVARARGGEADALLDGVDVLAMPTTRQPPMTIEEAEGILERGDVLEAEAKADFYNTTIFDLTGQPAVSLPCGLTSAGLPVGLMLVARQWDEPTLLRAARAYEMVRGPFPSPPIT